MLKEWSMHVFSWTFTVNTFSDYFCRLIESSLGNIATKFNFFIHNLAQLRFTGLPSNDEPILSFSPKTYSFRQDGRIKEVSVFTYHKKYNPDKHYVSLVFCICRDSCLMYLLFFPTPFADSATKFQAFVLFTLLPMIQK